MQIVKHVLPLGAGGFGLLMQTVDFSAQPALIEPARIVGFALIFVCAAAFLFQIVFPKTDRFVNLIVGTGVAFDFYKASGFHHKNHLIRIGIQNRSKTQQMTDCEVVLSSINGRLSGRCPVKIKCAFSLSPGAVEYIDFVDFEQAIKGPPISSPPGITAHFPINPLSNGESYLDDQPYSLTITATAAQSMPHKINCRLYVDNGVLKLESH